MFAVSPAPPNLLTGGRAMATCAQEPLQSPMGLVTREVSVPVRCDFSSCPSVSAWHDARLKFVT